MNQRIILDSPARMLVFFCLAVLVYLFAMQARLGPELADDGAFFLRYAENMLNGEFWVWNPGEAPVWGASAPLYPLVIALPMAFGMSPEAAIIGVGLTLASASLAAVTIMLGHRFGFITGLAFLAFAALDTYMMYFSGAGLETPLTIALLAFALWTLLYPPRAWIIGLAAGLLMVNKLDLVPVGGLLLLAHWFQEKRLPKIAIMVATVIALAWYGFAWWHFGAPVPNSFLTKSLYQNNHPKSIDWTWFSGFVFWIGIHKWLTGLSALALWRKERVLLPLVFLLGGMLLVHLVAYTVKYPFEPYNWYAMPALFALLVGGAVGVGALAEYAGRRFQKRSWIAGAIAIAILGLVFFTSIRSEIMGTSNIKMFASHHEFDRAEAGRWVAKNTPKDFRVFTMWGNPAYYSERYVLDGSFLNRKFEDASLVQKYKPEILIMQNNPGSTPGAPVFAFNVDKGYRAVKIFDKTYSAGMDYFFVVLAREDVVGQVTNVETPRELIPFVQQSVLGDKFGILKNSGTGALFVHPGLTTPTRFDFDLASFAAASGQASVKLGAAMAPNVPEEAVKRGAVNVRLKIMSSDKLLAEPVVTVGHPYQLNLSVTEHPKLTIIVDNNGSPDTDWLIFSVR